MKLIMDADCLIKLTKANLKEASCDVFSIAIPGRVYEEVVKQGREKGRDDAFVIERNVENGRIRMKQTERTKARSGEAEVVAIFLEGGFDAIGSDDRKFVGRLKLAGISYLTPAVCLALIAKKKKWDRSEALSKLDSLAPWISDEEYQTVRLFLERGGKT
jgi:predicted nucleic acid-binding protein